MLGAIVGDMVGSPYEFAHTAIKTTDFELFTDQSRFTDDTVMTVAVAEALLSDPPIEAAAKGALTAAMRGWAADYPDAGYGAGFRHWLQAPNPEPYGSYGNGSAMRVSAAGWLYPTLEQTEHWAAITAAVTHNHPEGIKGAEATAAAIFLARTGAPNRQIKDYLTQRFGYDLSRPLDQIRPDYHRVESCQETVPQAITAFLEAPSFEEAVRLAVSLGGDADTLAAIAGSMAQGRFGVPEPIRRQATARLTSAILQVLDSFEQRVGLTG